MFNITMEGVIFRLLRCNIAHNSVSNHTFETFEAGLTLTTVNCLQLSDFNSAIDLMVSGEKRTFYGLFWIENVQTEVIISVILWFGVLVTSWICRKEYFLRCFYDGKSVTAMFRLEAAHNLTEIHEPRV